MCRICTSEVSCGSGEMVSGATVGEYASTYHDSGIKEPLDLGFDGDAAVDGRVGQADLEAGSVETVAVVHNTAQVNRRFRPLEQDSHREVLDSLVGEPRTQERHLWKNDVDSPVLTMIIVQPTIVASLRRKMLLWFMEYLVYKYMNDKFCFSTHN